MARTATTYDVFSAIGEPRRRVLIEKLALEELSVNDLVQQTRWSQPTVSKHLSVLRQVGLVTERKQGRSRIYRIRPEELRPIQEWIHKFEKYWGNTLDQLDNYLQNLQAKGGEND